MIYVIVIFIVAFKCFFCIVVKILKRKKKFVKKKKNYIGTEEKLRKTKQQMMSFKIRHNIKDPQ